MVKDLIVHGINHSNMKAPLFEFPSFQYEIDDWEFKKKGILKRINQQKFVRQVPGETNVFLMHEGDRATNNKSYIHYLSKLLHSELSDFCQEAQVTCSMTDAWCVRYQKGDQQIIHNHRGWGFSGVLYVEYDPKVHTPTCFMCPWQNPSNDTTSLVFPQNVKEGTIFIAPSFTHHFVHPNQSRKPRTVISFDLLPQLPDHQSLNRNV